MRVEVRRRVVASPVGAASAATASDRPGSPINFGIVEAYQDSCFVSPTRFYTVSPEHPKLGKWATPSTLKYSQPTQTTQQAFAATHCLDETAISAATRSRHQRPTCCSSCCASPAVGRGGCHAKKGAPSSSTRSAAAGGEYHSRGSHHIAESKMTASSAGGGYGGGGGSAADASRHYKRPVSPAGALRWGGSESPPPSPPWGLREVPRIHTSVSGRVSDTAAVTRPLE